MAGDAPGALLTRHGRQAVPQGQPRADRTDTPDPEAPGAGASFLAKAYVVLLVAIPSVYVVGPLGSVGTPAGILGCLLLGVWVVSRVSRSGPALGTTPVHWLALLFVAGTVAALCAGAQRAMQPVEYTAMLRGAVTVCAWVGVALFVSDAFRSRSRLWSGVSLLVGMGTVLALLGAFQFVTSVDIVNSVPIPGLTLNSASVSVYERAGFARVNATTLHAIEFATVLSMLLPLAVAQAVRRRTTGSLVQVLLIAGALPLTVSRSGMLGLGFGLVFTFLVVGARERLVMLALVPLGAGVFVAVTPGLLGTIRDLFLSAGEDTSISARTDDYPAVEAFFQQAPWLGRGPFTFLPSMYRTLDNQYLGTLVEGGIVGLACLVTLLVGVVVVALRLGRRVPPGPDRVLCWSLAGAVVIAMVLFSTFDAFSFPMCAGILFVVIGLVGAAGRSLGEVEVPDGSRGGRSLRVTSRLSVAALAGAVLLSGASAVVAAPPSWQAGGQVALAVPGHDGQNIYYGKLEIAGVSDLVLRVMDDDATRARLSSRGVTDYQVAASNGSLAPYSEVRGSGDVLQVGVVAADPATAADGARIVLAEIESVLADLQGGRGIPTLTQVSVVESYGDAPGVVELATHRALGLAAAGVLALMVACLVWAALRRWRSGIAAVSG